MKPILEIENISKKFRILHERQPYLSLRDSFTSLFKPKSATQEDFWALKDVSFDVMPGDTVGIIGKNGAGKSTLLKILSKITPPTSGKITGRGRIASLLEVGTGFHPELSGRENVFLNGSILGMRRAEIQRNFDAIVDFAGVAKFIDTPLKHYSSGMQLRLAFAVAAFLENEILIVDEVLAVGDVEFQKKCFSKMEDVSKSGRTILFVSHNLEALANLCRSCVLLQGGQVAFQGDLHAGITHYLDTFKDSDSWTFVNKDEKKPEVYLQSAKILNTGPINNAQEVAMEFTVCSQKALPFSFHLFVFRESSLSFICADYHSSVHESAPDKNTVRFTATIPAYLLNPGHHNIGVMLADFSGNQQQYYNQMNIFAFEVADDGYRRGNRYNLGWGGAVSPLLAFKTMTP